MFTFFQKFFYTFLHDEMKFRRWMRSLLMAVATGGMGFADQMAALVNAPVKWIKVSAVIAGFISVAINLGENNPKGEEAEKQNSEVIHP